MVIVYSAADNIVISGIGENEIIELYDLSGTLLYQGVADSMTFTIPYSCKSGNIYIIKVGADAIKYLFSPFR